MVSVIMSVYNEDLETLQKSIFSILNQTMKDLQLIIILDNPDNCLAKNKINEWCQQDCRMEMYCNEKNLGLVGSLNKALRYAKGEYIARMDSDDIADINRLEKELAVLKKNNLDVVMGSIRLIDEKDQFIANMQMKDIIPEQFREIMKYGVISTHPTWLMKKKVYDKLRGYRDVTKCEDVDFILRALQNGYRCGRMKDIVLSYRIRRNGISQSNALEQKQKERYLRKAYRCGVSLERLNVQKINQRFGSYSKEEKEKYQQQNRIMENFSERFAKKKYISCIYLTMKYYFNKKYFRQNYNDYVRFYFALLCK